MAELLVVVATPGMLEPRLLALARLVMLVNFAPLAGYRIDNSRNSPPKASKSLQGSD